ncbi:hypothetical protein LFL97_20745 [Burkholderia sp. JSH-S8]|nr:hypothetical protein LFL97_20745 [Burkholderia sp. JSH-S8]
MVTGISWKPAIALLAAIVSFSRRHALHLVDQQDYIVDVGNFLNKIQLPLVEI